MTVQVDYPGWIQKGIDFAASGGTVNVRNGNYTEALNIYKDLSLIGQSRAGVIINASSFVDYGVDANGDYDYVFQSFTMDGPDVAAWGYGIKVSGNLATAAVSDVEVYGCGRSGIDFNGLSSGSVTNVSSPTALERTGVIQGTNPITGQPYMSEDAIRTISGLKDLIEDEAADQEALEREIL